MLIEFSVENHLSFKNRVTLSMVAAKREKSLSQNVYKSHKFKGLDLLKVVAIYGANASGKTNLFDAIFRSVRLITASLSNHRLSTFPPITFKLDSAYKTKPSTFEFVFLADDIRYLYGFTKNSKIVHHEWLYSYPKNQPRLLFERTLNPKGEDFKYKFGTYWKGPKKNIQIVTHPEELFLPVASRFDCESAKTVCDWFNRKYRFISRSEPFGAVLQEAFKGWAYADQNVKDNILKFLKFADLGIDAIQLDKIILKEEQLNLFREKFGQDYPDHRYEVTTFHSGFDENGKKTDVPFSFEEESQGTQHFFNLSMPFLLALQEGLTLVVDELDSGLHPLLTRWIVDLFQNEKSNPKNAQLIFMTHDSSLLEPNLFRRDQIWFTEKNLDGATQLYSLWDYKKLPRKTENIKRGYLSGRYGAIPILEQYEEG
jgi:AAA15 family ATPase/GTPase